MLKGTMRLCALLLAISLTLGVLPPVAVFADELPEEPSTVAVDEVSGCDAGHTWVEADCDTAKTCSVCGETEGEALGHIWQDAEGNALDTCSGCGLTQCEALGHAWANADCDTAKTCTVCGATEGEALGHSWQETEAGNVCSGCGTVEEPEQENEILPISDEELTVEDYDTFLAELKVLEQYADEYAATSGKSAGELIVNFIRTGVERYQDGNWKVLAGEEITGFTAYVQEQDAANATTVMRLRNIVIEDFYLPNGDQTDFGHMFGTMNISYVAPKSADLAGWAGDLCDLLLFSKEYGNVPAGTVDEMAAYILENCFGVDADDAFGWDDFYGDLDAFYLINEWKGTDKKLSDIMEAYYTDDLDNADRSAYFMNNRFSGLETQEDVRAAVYNTYSTDIGLQVLEADRGLSDANELREAACYAFADYLFAQGGDRLEGDTDEPTDPSEPNDPSEPTDPENPGDEDPTDPEAPENTYYEDFSVTESYLAPGISQSIHYALTADNRQLVYYVATVDVTRDDVTVMANYRHADPSKGWGMARVQEQAEALITKHTNPADAENYIENFNVVVATNGDGYNMSTGEPGGLLVMGGVEYHPVDKDGFFAILKDGSAMIGTRADYDIYKDQIQEAIGGFGKVLIKDGEIAVSKTANYTKDRASRTAVGITASGAVVMMVMDGRQEPFSCGGSYEEIAQVMYEAGCVEAINLDGGGSTTYLSKAEGADSLALVNRPSDGYARSVAATLAAVSTSKMTNEFDHANISFDYDYLTIGSSVTGTAVGVSGSGNAAPVPEDAVWMVSDESIGTITQEGVFTAADNGDVDVKLVQGEKVLGTKTLHVVEPDGIAFEREKMNIIFGVPVDLPVLVYFDGKPVAYNENDVILALTNENAGWFEGTVFTADPEAGIRNVTAAAFLMTSEEAYALMDLNIYKDGEAVFNFDDITDGNRQLAWKRGVSNSTTADKTVYSIDDPSKAMDITYVFGLDMESIEIPAQLADLTYMLPGADAGSTAWDFLLQLAERISVLTEVKIIAQFDQDLEIDVSNMSVMNEYFYLKSADLNPETNELTITCGWIDQTKAIDPATANPICILSGIKATPKDGAWKNVDQLEIVNTGRVSYRVYLRANALYSFAKQPANQEKYGLLPYSSNETGYEGGTESGAYFGTTYAEFEDRFTLDKALKQGWYTSDDQAFYYVDHVALTGIHKLPSLEDPSQELFYEFGEDGACTGKVTGLFEYDGGLMYAILGQRRIGWQAVYDRNGNLCDYYFDPYTGKAVDGECRVEGYDYIFTDHVLTRGDLVTDSQGTRYRWAGLWVSGKWFDVGEDTYHTAKYQTYVTTGYKHVVGPDLNGGWFLFDENGVFQKNYSGKFDYEGKTYLLENGKKLEEPGLVLLDDGYYYYFGADGSAIKNRTYWPTKTNGLLPMGPYKFDAEGRITNAPGQVEPEKPETPDTPDTPDTPAEKKNGIYKLNGTLYYYKDDVIQYNAGLVVLENEDGTVDYIYVRSNGQLAIGNYWITNHNNILPVATYNFGADGIMTNPPGAEPEEPKPEEPKPEEPKPEEPKPEEPKPEEPKPEEPKPVKQGIVSENGVLYYYVDGVRAYCAGLVMITNDDGSVDYIYVRSNGQLAIGKYWATNDNGLLPQKEYTFGADGLMINPPVTEPETPPVTPEEPTEPETPEEPTEPSEPSEPETPVEPEVPAKKNGIVEVNGKRYYYKDDVIQYGAGVVKLTDENGVDFYIYVRSNGQLATGKYWTTTTNGLLKEKEYNFGTDGRLYL